MYVHQDRRQAGRCGVEYIAPDFRQLLLQLGEGQRVRLRDDSLHAPHRAHVAGERLALCVEVSKHEPVRFVQPMLGAEEDVNATEPGASTTTSFLGSCPTP